MFPESKGRAYATSGLCSDIHYFKVQNAKFTFHRALLAAYGPHLNQQARKGLGLRHPQCLSQPHETKGGGKSPGCSSVHLLRSAEESGPWGTSCVCGGHRAWGGDFEVGSKRIAIFLASPSILIAPILIPKMDKPGVFAWGQKFMPVWHHNSQHTSCSHS